MRRMFALAVLAITAACAAPGTAPGVDWTDPALATLASPHPNEAAQGTFLLVDKSDRLLVVYQGGRAIRAYRAIQFGDAPMGHKRFEGDERTPEGRYVIDARNPASAYHLSLRISYPNAADRTYAAAQGRSPGGDIFIHGQPNALPFGRVPGDWTDGCIALDNREIEELWRIVPDGTPIEIRQ